MGQFQKLWKRCTVKATLYASAVVWRRAITDAVIPLKFVEMDR